MTTFAKLVRLIDVHRESIEKLEALRQESGPLPLAAADLIAILMDGEGGRQRRQQVLEDLVSTYAPLLAKPHDPAAADDDAFVAAYLQRYGQRELAAARQEVSLHDKLAALYALLATAPDSAWTKVLELRVRRRLQIVRPLMANLVSERDKP